MYSPHHFFLAISVIKCTYIYLNCLSINNPPGAVLVSIPRALLSMSDCMSVLVSARHGRLTIFTVASATGNTPAKGRKKSNYLFIVYWVYWLSSA